MSAPREDLRCSSCLYAETDDDTEQTYGKDAARCKRFPPLPVVPGPNFVFVFPVVYVGREYETYYWCGEWDPASRRVAD